jgi:hypothetical protein
MAIGQTDNPEEARLGFASPITAITRDHGDVGGLSSLFRPCSLPVRSLFRMRREIFKSHGISVLHDCGDQNAEIFPVFFPVTREFGPIFFPANRN